MTVDQEWAQRHLGVDLRRGDASVRSPADPGVAWGDALQRRLIDFDSETDQLAALRRPDRPPSASTPLSEFVDIPWPAGLAPAPEPVAAGESLPPADVLIVTWTVDEGHALSRVLTPGRDSQPPQRHDGNLDTQYWKPYTKNYAAISAEMVPDCPARALRRLGTYCTARIGSHRVVLFKSDSHMSQDGPRLANATVWRQIIDDSQPAWIITTGTGGAIGPDLNVGDVVVSRFASFDCERKFASLNGETFACETDAPSDKFDEARALFDYNARFLPLDRPRAPQIAQTPAASQGVLTTDFFGFDNSDNTFGLEGKGTICEMGDAVLGMVCLRLGPTAPNYVMVRNVSDPKIDATGLTIQQQATLAASIYEAYGLWSTVCSAITCWSIVAAL